MPDERKSSRLAKRTLQSAIADDYQDESDSEFDEEELVNKKRGSAAKRKAAGSTTAGPSKGQPPKKKARGMRGLLSNVVDMPVDVLFEVGPLFRQSRDATYCSTLTPNRIDLWSPPAY